MSERLWGILVDSFGKILLPGLTVTIPLTAISFTQALIIAVAVALVQFAHVPVLQRLARFYIWVIRGTPVLVQLFVVFYGLPGVGILIEPFPAAVLVFSINEGAYCAETIRAALEAILDYGRPKTVELLVLVDRGHRELPIHGDYVGRKINTARSEKVNVLMEERDGRDEVVLESADA